MPRLSFLRARYLWMLFFWLALMGMLALLGKRSRDTAQAPVVLCESSVERPAEVPSSAPRPRAERPMQPEVKPQGRTNTAAETPPKVRMPEPPESIARFRRWFDAYQEAQGSGERQLLAEEGCELAAARRIVMRELIEIDPDAAAAFALDAADRMALPEALAEQMETHVSGVGSVETACVLPAPGQSLPHPYLRQVWLGGVTYEAFVTSRLGALTTEAHARLSGIALDGRMVVCAAQPATQAEARAAGRSPVQPLNANKLSNSTLLYIITRFSDEASDPLSVAQAQTYMDDCDRFFNENSYGAASIATTIVQVQLDVTKDYAMNNYTYSTLIDAARTKATQQGYNYSNYNLDIVATVYIGGANFGYAGRAAVDGQRCHLNGYFSLRTAGHELGHNYGLWHSDYWLSDHASPIGQDSAPGGHAGDGTGAEIVEYGSRISLMSAQFGTDMDDGTAHFTIQEKYSLGWLNSSNVPTLSSNGTYRIYRHDHKDTGGVLRGFETGPSSGYYLSQARKYFVEYRTRFAQHHGFENGATIHLGLDSYIYSDVSENILLDMTPQSHDGPHSGSTYTHDNTDKLDAALPIGRTFSDTAAGLHITPIARGGSAPDEWLDVVLNVGSFPGNQPPTVSLSADKSSAAPGESVAFTATASDPNGDTLAYSFNFGNGTFSYDNSATTVTCWPGPGTFTVTVTVSDRMGGTATGSVQVTVSGAPINNDLANAIALPGGGVYEGGNTGANKQGSENNHAGFAGGRSVWWEWTAPSNGHLTVETTGSKRNNFSTVLDTLLGVYTGDAFPLTLVAGNDDVDGYATSRVEFLVTQGVEYKIAVDGYGSSDVGPIRLMLTFRPAPSLDSGPTASPNPVTLQP